MRAWHITRANTRKREDSYVLSLVINAITKVYNKRHLIDWAGLLYLAVSLLKECNNHLLFLLSPLSASFVQCHYARSLLHRFDRWLIWNERSEWLCGRYAVAVQIYLVVSDYTQLDVQHVTKAAFSVTGRSHRLELASR